MNARLTELCSQLQLEQRLVKKHTHTHTHRENYVLLRRKTTGQTSQDENAVAVNEVREVVTEQRAPR